MTSPIHPYRRIAGMLLLALLLAVALGYAVGRTDAAPRSAPEPVPPTAFRSVIGAPTTGTSPAEVIERPEGQTVRRSGAPTPAAAAQPTAPAASVPGTSTGRIVGIASWGDFGGHVVTRLPRGTSILVTGPQGAWTGSSWGYGPDPSIFPERIVDLDREIFRSICGDPATGICAVTLDGG